jgi:uncharacterized protein
MPFNLFNSIEGRAILALILIVPASSIGALMSAFIAPGIIGQLVAIGCGIWMICLPICWVKFIDRQEPRFKLIHSNGAMTIRTGSGLAIGIGLGVFMFAVIIGIYLSIGRYWLDISEIRSRVDRMQMNVPLMVFGFGTFQTLVNSFVEEYVWRWFVYQKCEQLVSTNLAVYLSALFFTIHHVILMVAYTSDWRAISIGILAVFIAGVIWARCFRIDRSLLPSYLSHLAADLALQIVSWHVLLA